MDGNHRPKGAYSTLNKITILFIFGFVALLFFSRTIYEYNLPGVTVGYTEEAHIITTLRAEGQVYLEGEADIIAGYDGRIEWAVAEGQEVKEGDILFSIVSDLQSIEEELDTLKKNRDTYNINIRKLNNDIDYYSNAAGRESSIAPLDLTVYDLRLEKSRQALEKAQGDLMDLQALYDEGGIPRTQVAAKESEIRELELQLEEDMADKNDAVASHNKQIEDESRKASDEFKENQKNVTDLNYQRSSYMVELDYTNRRIETLTNQLNNSGKTDIAADYDGRVTNIYPEAKTGRYVGKNTIALSMLPADANPIVRFSIREKFDHMVEGDPVSLNINFRRRYDLPGYIKKIYTNDDTTIVEAVFEEKIQFNGGETIEALFEKRSARYPTVVPAAAVREGGGGKYLLYVTRVKNSLGYDYVAKEIAVKVAHQDKNNVYVTWVSDRGEDLPIIINSDKAVFAGDKLKIVSQESIQWE